MKNVNEMVWPVENYTDKIHFGLRMMFATYPWLTFSTGQMETHLVKGFNWLDNPNERQRLVLDKIIRTGIRKLIQAGKVKKVTSRVSVEDQWIAVANVADSGYTSVTSNCEVALTEEAKKASNRRSIGARKLWALNKV
jgi:hypothetical protein